MAFMQKSTLARQAKLISIAFPPYTFHNRMVCDGKCNETINAQTTELEIQDQKLAKAKKLLDENTTTHTELVNILDSLLRENPEEQNLQDMKRRLDTLCRNDNSCEIDVEPAEALDSEYLHELIKTRNDKRSEIKNLNREIEDLKAKNSKFAQEELNLKTRAEENSADLNSLRAEHEAALAEMQNKHKKDMQNLQNEQQASLTKVQTKHKKDMQSLQEKNAKKFSEEEHAASTKRQRLLESNEKELKALQQEHQTKITDETENLHKLQAENKAAQTSEIKILRTSMAQTASALKDVEGVAAVLDQVESCMQKFAKRCRANRARNASMNHLRWYVVVQKLWVHSAATAVMQGVNRARDWCKLEKRFQYSNEIIASRSFRNYFAEDSRVFPRKNFFWCKQKHPSRIFAFVLAPDYPKACFGEIRKLQPSAFVAKRLPGEELHTLVQQGYPRVFKSPATSMMQTVVQWEEIDSRMRAIEHYLRVAASNLSMQLGEAAI